ncbi:sensor domain-containing protein [Dactylosporangium sp. AC04546]|uniref:sensor domain-containing protein n=1 Tax=Dactylosporangium sp. AC04546 TaxID=2862460 RepID=UPI001EDD8869|nr:sensor domain-containing protein [Dactylosporangium sp. AC04546]WVK81266.1 sensor domain-containing protein [Dactylosporangium sp. AC04546]
MTTTLPRLAADTRYVLTGFPVALASLVLCVTTVSLGVGLAVLWVGVPLVLAALGLARTFAVAERDRISAVLGTPVPQPAYGTGARRMLTDPRSWRDLAHALLRWIPNTVSFSVVAGWWAAALGSLTWSLWGWSLPDGPDDHELPELIGLGDAYLTAVVFYLVLAAFFALTLPAVARAAARFEAECSRALLGRRDGGA